MADPGERGLHTHAYHYHTRVSRQRCVCVSYLDTNEPVHFLHSLKFTQRRQAQIVIHTGKQVDSFVSVRTVRPVGVGAHGGGGGSAPGGGGSGAGGETSNDAGPQHVTNYIQCPEKYLLEIMDVQ